MKKLKNPLLRFKGADMPEADHEAKLVSAFLEEIHYQVHVSMKRVMDRYFAKHGRWPRYVFVEPWPVMEFPKKIVSVATDEPPPPNAQFVIFPGRLNKILQAYDIAEA